MSQFCGSRSALMSRSGVTSAANAGDTDGTVSSVAFFANGVAIGSDATSPYSITWSPAAGDYTLTAVATDNLGATTPSVGVLVHVTAPNTPPTVSITAPR